MPISLYISQWLLVGVCTLALPQSVVRSISYKDTKALSNAMIIGTIMIGAITLVATWIGVLSKGILTNPSIAAYGGSVDNITPRTIVACMSPFWAGVTIIGPIAATISTISSLLLTGSSSIIKDIYMNVQAKKGREVTNDQVKKLSMACTLIMGLAVYFIAIVPPDLIWKINMFAFGGLETAFFWVMIFGMFWSKANSKGALWCLVGGVLSYCATMALGIKVFSLHQIVIGIGVSLILFLIGNSLGKPTEEKVLRVFFPDQYED
jgi:sodium/pantothenate symporter